MTTGGGVSFSGRAAVVAAARSGAPGAGEDHRGRGSPPPGGRLLTGRPVAGVDGCRGGWVAVVLDAGGRASARRVARIDELLDLDVEVLGVDIPIGLPETGARACDLEVRRFLGARRASLFPAPPRPVLEAPSHAEAVERARALTGKGVSRQAFALGPRILEVEGPARADARLAEVHPEASFAVLAGAPAAHSKHTAAGLAERSRLLLRARLALPDAPRGVPQADLLDAAAAAWSAARIAHGAARAFPAGGDPHTGVIRV